jgi:hypothetical protein
MRLPQERSRREPKLRLGPAVGGPCQTCVEVDGFRAGGPQRVLHADARRLWRIDPAGEGRQPFGDGQRIVVDDIVDPLLCRQRGDGRSDRVIDVNERPVGIPFADNRSLALADLIRNGAARPVPSARTLEEAVAQDDPIQPRRGKDAIFIGAHGTRALADLARCVVAELGAFVGKLSGRRIEVAAEYSGRRPAPELRPAGCHLPRDGGGYRCVWT